METPSQVKSPPGVRARAPPHQLLLLPRTIITWASITIKHTTSIPPTLFGRIIYQIHPNLSHHTTSRGVFMQYHTTHTNARACMHIFFSKRFMPGPKTNGQALAPPRRQSTCIRFLVLSVGPECIDWYHPAQSGGMIQGNSRLTWVFSVCSGWGFWPSRQTCCMNSIQLLLFKYVV